VTDRLHLGHALNNTLQDVLVRTHRMKGFETLWMPGTDHAGIATQAVVERRLRKEGTLKGSLKESMRRDEFVAKVQAFKDEYEATITGQLKAMGCSCDWPRQRFTMDEVCVRAVYEAFFRLFKDGLIYRGKRLVNWDPVLQTAVADDETEDVEVDGQMYYLRYPLVHPHGAVTQRELSRGKSAPEAPVPVTWSELRSRGWSAIEDAEHADEKQAWVTVATTRPETYLGDTAVAVNPKDPRAKPLRGLCVELPLVGRVIPIIEDDYVVLPAAMQEDPEAAKSDPKAAIATGFLKVTPAHDANDYAIGQRHNLKMINVLAPDASISDQHGWPADDVRGAHIFIGKSREDARKLVVAEFKARGLFAKAVPYRHSVPHSDRSKAAIEPYLSDQWYVKVTDERLAPAALRAMSQRARQRGSETARQGGDGELTFFPERYAKTFEMWHENIRDWCISRQLWWGHRIPVWVSATWKIRDSALDAPTPAAGINRDMRVGEQLGIWEREGRISFRGEQEARPGHEWNALSERDSDRFVCLRDPLDREIVDFLEANRFERDPDVLDTWFSSALWPISTMGWPDPGAAGPEFKGLLEAFNPSSTLCTAREIITLWVSRMVMFNRYFRGEDLGSGPGHGPLPFRDVFIHAMIQDEHGRKMSKMLGNGVDPLDIIATQGSDAMRYTLVKMTTQTQDVRMPVVKDAATGRNTSPKFDEGRNFCNKLWQVATGFALSKLGPPTGPESPRSREHLLLVDRWMLSRLEAGVRRVNNALAAYEFNEYAEAVYQLLWWDFCDVYVEAIKPTISGDAMQRAVLAHALEVITRLLHPIAPYVTEAVWERLRDVKTLPVPGIALGPSRKGGMLCTAGWPEVDSSLHDERAEFEFGRVKSLIDAINQVRAKHKVLPRRRVTLHCSADIDAICRRAGGLVEALAMVERITSETPKGPAAAFTVGAETCHLSNMADEVDAGAERARLEKAIADSSRSVETLEKRLANPGYSEKAPPAMVQQTRDQLAKAKAERDAAAEALRRLG
jgi:valyl-tRNA synthetase